MNWNFENGIPVWSQICEKIKRSIIMGEYQPFERIPGVRELAAQAEVNPNTMQRALVKLEEEGLLITRATSGRFVSGDSDVINRERNLILSDAAAVYLKSCAELGVTREQAINILKKEDNNLG